MLPHTPNVTRIRRLLKLSLETAEVKKLTDSSANEASPSWSPDGTRILFCSDRSGKWEIYMMKIDGTEVRQLTTTAGD
jgi:TolB protein